MKFNKSPFNLKKLDADSDSSSDLFLELTFESVSSLEINILPVKVVKQLNFYGVSDFTLEFYAYNNLLLNGEAVSDINALFKTKTQIEFIESSCFGLVNSLKFSLEGSSSFSTGIADLQTSLILEMDSGSSFNLVSNIINDNFKLYILNSDFSLVAILEQYNDFVWNRRWRKIDDFELTVNQGVENSRYLLIDYYIGKKVGNLLRLGRISDRNLKKDNNGASLTIKGKGLGEIFKSRIAFNGANTGDGYDSFQGNAESAMKHYLENNIVSPENTERKIDSFTIEKNRNWGDTVSYRARFQPISEILYEISKISGLGWDLLFDYDNKEFIFKVLKAKIKKGVRLNPKFESVKMINFREQSSSGENSIIIAGQGEGSDRMIRTVSK